MNNRYKIRIYESGDGYGNLAAGTVVLPIDRSFLLEAACADEIERRLRKEVTAGKLSGGRVYQICPGIGNPEPIRSVAICGEAKAKRVVLEAANGLYSEFRRIRYLEAATGRESMTAQREAVPA